MGNLLKLKMLKRNFEPRFVPGLRFLLDPSDTSTITESRGSVSQFDDKSSFKTNVVQAVGARQPTTGISTINGLNVLDYDGGDSLQSAVVPLITQPIVIFVVSELAATGAQEFLFDGLTFNGSNTLFHTATTPSFFAGAPIIGGTTTDIPTIRTFIANGVNSVGFVNGVSVVTGNAGTNSLDGFTLGARFSNTQFLTGKIGEVIVYNRLLSAIEIATIVRFLVIKWGIVLS